MIPVATYLWRLYIKTGKWKIQQCIQRQVEICLLVQQIFHLWRKPVYFFILSPGRQYRQDYCKGPGSCFLWNIIGTIQESAFIYLPGRDIDILPPWGEFLFSKDTLVFSIASHISGIFYLPVRLLLMGDRIQYFS